MVMIPGKSSNRLLCYLLVQLAEVSLVLNRCRGWYDTGRRLALELGSSLHITAPYSFAISGRVGQSATSPVVDPSTGEPIAQVLNDFFSNSVFDALSPQNTPLAKNGFPVLIAVQGETAENTVIGPGFNIGDDATEIARVVLPHDLDCKARKCRENVETFRGIVESFQRVEVGDSHFRRTTPTGEEETVYLAGSPVIVRNIRPLNSSDFARGIEVDDYHIYSLGLCETRPGLLEGFDALEDEVSRLERISAIVIAGTVILASLLIMLISYHVTASLSSSMLYLLDLIRSINRYVLTADCLSSRTCRFSPCC